MKTTFTEKQTEFLIKNGFTKNSDTEFEYYIENGKTKLLKVDEHFILVDEWIEYDGYDLPYIEYSEIKSKENQSLEEFIYKNFIFDLDHFITQTEKEYTFEQFVIDKNISNKLLSNMNKHYTKEWFDDSKLKIAKKKFDNYFQLKSMKN